MRINICHLYPDLMCIYGDRGNVITLKRRCEWYGLDVRVRNVLIGDRISFNEEDVIFLGGGQDKEQRLISADLQGVKGELLRTAAERGVACLGICGGFQLFGHYYQTAEGEKIPGISIFDAWTIAGDRRMIGNAVVETQLPSGQSQLIVGFENHAGKTYLGKVKPFGKVKIGFGNNGEDGLEGAFYRNAIGTYLHGSLLPKNPWLADYIIFAALRRKYGEVPLPALDNRLEGEAHAAALKIAKDKIKKS